MVMGQCKVILVGTWWYLVSMRRYWLILGGTGSVWSSTGWYLAIRVFYREPYTKNQILSQKLTDGSIEF